MKNTSEEVREYECPNCGGPMYASGPDNWCLECIHEGRV